MTRSPKKKAAHEKHDLGRDAEETFDHVGVRGRYAADSGPWAEVVGLLQQYFDRLFAMNAKDRVRRDLGNGAVSYQGVQAVDTPQLTLWRFTFYGGLLFSGRSGRAGGNHA